MGGEREIFFFRNEKEYEERKMKMPKKKTMQRKKEGEGEGEKEKERERECLGGVCVWGKVVGPWVSEIIKIKKKVRKYYLNKRWCIIDNLMRVFLQIDSIK